VVWVVGTAGALQINPRRNIAERFVPRRAEDGEATRGVVTDGDRVRMLTVDGMVRQLDARTAVARQLDLLEQHEAGAVLRIDRRVDRSR
jgi:hypothetical protein